MEPSPPPKTGSAANASGTLTPPLSPSRRNSPNLRGRQVSPLEDDKEKRADSPVRRLEKIELPKPLPIAQDIPPPDEGIKKRISEALNLEKESPIVDITNKALSLPEERSTAASSHNFLMNMTVNFPSPGSPVPIAYPAPPDASLERPRRRSQSPAFEREPLKAAIEFTESTSTPKAPLTPRGSDLPPPYPTPPEGLPEEATAVESVASALSRRGHPTQMPAPPYAQPPLTDGEEIVSFWKKFLKAACCVVYVTKVIAASVAAVATIITACVFALQMMMTFLSWIQTAWSWIVGGVSALLNCCECLMRCCRCIGKCNQFFRKFDELKKS